MTHVGALEPFIIGIGPSSSRTVGPMRAARAFVGELQEKHVYDKVSRTHISVSAKRDAHPSSNNGDFKKTSPPPLHDKGFHRRWFGVWARGPDKGHELLRCCDIH